MARQHFATDVLSDALVNRIAQRRVIAAVFTTYTFDPGFFELNVVPLLFAERAFSHIDKVKRIQLEDALQGTRGVSVYYDGRALAQDATPAVLDFDRIDVRRHGCFHPKLVLVLVENPPSESSEDAEADTRHQSLIVGTVSANLTQSGWWESVEAAHFEEIWDLAISERRCPFRQDLLYAIRQVRNACREGDPDGPLDVIHEFLRQRVRRDTFTKRGSRGSYYTRLFAGQGALPEWLVGELALDRFEWNLEIVSPFFDSGHAKTLKALIEATGPRQVRVFLPTNPDGEPDQVDEETYDAIAECASWSKLPESLTQRSGGARAMRLAPRGVHAKVYRFWSRNNGELVIVGSVNLTDRGHSHARAGNLEAAFVAQTADPGAPLHSWLTPLDEKPIAFPDESATEDSEQEQAVVDITFRFDWSASEHGLSYRIDEPGDGPLEVCEPGGPELFVIEHPEASGWVRCHAEASARVRSILVSTSFLLVRHPRGQWRVLVREDGMSCKPSVLKQLTPEEILLYWSLLSPAQREAFILDKLRAEADWEGLKAAGERTRYLGQNTMFSRFAGIFHAFGCLRRHVQEALVEGREKEAEARLFGEKYDSVPVLLERVDADRAADPVSAYVTYLCAQQLRDQVAAEHKDGFWASHLGVAARLDERLNELPEIRARIELEGYDRSEFFTWYERVFLRPFTPKERDNQ